MQHFVDVYMLCFMCEKYHLEVAVHNNNNNNTHDNVYSAVIMTTRSLREFTRFI